MCLIYSGGLPIMYPILFLNVLITYWMDKLLCNKILNLVVKYNRLPPRYDLSLSNKFLKSMVWAIFLHMCFSVWIYGNTLYFTQDFIISSITANGKIDLYNIPARLLSKHNIILVGGLAAVLIFIIVKLFSIDYFIYTIFCECCSSSTGKVESKPLVDALSIQALYKNHLFRNNQFSKIPNIHGLKYLNEFYQFNFTHERDAITIKLDSIKADYDKDELIYNFEEIIEKIIPSINDNFPLQTDYSYNIAHLPEYESYAK